MSRRVSCTGPGKPGPGSALLVWVWAMAAGMVLAACSTSGPSRAEAPSMVSAHASADPHDEIARLWDEILVLRGERGERADSDQPYVESEAVTAPQAAERAPRARSAPQRTARDLCPAPPRGASSRCGDVCTLAGAICDNAESICRIAGELGGDDWAASKCERARDACAEATERCCAC